jgi:hypothetical protein
MISALTRSEQGIHHTDDELSSWRTAFIGTGSGQLRWKLLRMICMPPTAYTNSGQVITLRFSGEGTRSSHMAGGMELLATWSHVMEMNTFVGVI